MIIISLTNSLLKELLVNSDHGLTEVTEAKRNVQIKDTQLVGGLYLSLLLTMTNSLLKRVVVVIITPEGNGG